MDVTTNQALKNWIDDVAELTQPDEIYWCNGSDEEFDAMAEKLELEESYAQLLATALEDATDSAQRMGLLSEENRPAMAAGYLPPISQGAYAGGEVDVEFIVPVEHAPELNRRFANLSLRPVLLTQELGLPVDAKCYKTASDFYRSSLISKSSYVRVATEYDEELNR